MNDDYNSEVLLSLNDKLKSIYPNGDELLIQIINTTRDIFSNYKIVKEINNSSNYSFSENITLYISIKRLEGLSESTLYNYELQLNKFDKYSKKTINNLNSMDIRLYLSQLTKVQAGSINSIIWCLKSYFKWLMEEKIIFENPMSKVKIIKTDKRLREPLSLMDVERLRDNCTKLRSRAVFEFFLATALRLAECVKMDKDMINWDSKTIKIMGKGRTEREVYFNDKTYYHLQKYLNSRTDDSPALFVTEKFPFGRLGKRAMENVINKIYKKSGITNKTYPHKLRTTNATNSLNGGMDITSVQKILGHSEISTTLLYAQKSKEIIKSEYTKFMNT